MMNASDSPFIPLALAVVLLVMLVFARSVRTLRIIEAMVCVSCCLSLLLFAYSIWFFREGLGFFRADRVEDWGKLAGHFQMPFLLVTATIALSIFLYRRRLVRVRRPII
jgi:formate hydrogenlyase subunit 3/multisubunit Na+/H+ antiporter MnhD subunit